MSENSFSAEPPATPPAYLCDTSTPPPQSVNLAVAQLPDSSPVKFTEPVTDGRKQVEASPIIRNALVDQGFLDNHLSTIPHDIRYDDFVDKESLEHLKKVAKSGHESEHYPSCATLLTKLSAGIYGSLDNTANGESSPLVFIPNGGKMLTYHPVRKSESAQSNFPSDVVGVPGPLDDYEIRPKATGTGSQKRTSAKGSTDKHYKNIPYHLVRTLVELKNPKRHGERQAISYAWYLFEACPHVAGLYVLSMQPKYYQISWVDACGPVKSPRYEWEKDDLTPLASYIYSLYVPPSGHHLRDSTIEPHIPSLPSGTSFQSALLNGLDGKLPHVKWNVTVGSQAFQDTEHVFWSGGFGRRTTIFRTGSASPDAGYIIKDMFRDELRRFTEQGMLELVHEKGIVPGVVRLEACEDVKVSPNAGAAETLRTVTDVQHHGKAAKRARTRLLLPSCGERLSEARNLSDLLKAFYDAVEAHRALVIERAVLHRDLSVNNILIYPKHRPLGEGEHYFKPQTPLRFIDDVLDPKPDSEDTDSACPTVKNDRSRCLIIDFDNSSPAHKDLIPAILKKTRPATDSTHELTPEDIEQALRERTGTPIFISRSVASGHTLHRRGAIVNFRPMPTLSDAAKEKYVAAYGISTYERWCDQGRRTHGGQVLPDNAEVPRFFHKPCHDVESIFWTLLYSLVKALPANSPPETSLADDVKDVRELVLQHTIKGSLAGNTNDETSRTRFLSGPDPESFHLTLHPKLQGLGLGVLLKRLAEQVVPEYAYLDPAPPIDHLHEAFRRILLDFIVDLDAHPDRNVELNPNKSRSLVEPSPVNTNGKRPAGESGNVEQGMLELVHEKGIVPGVVRLKAYEDVKVSPNAGAVEKLRTVTDVQHHGKTAKRARIRLLLPSCGERLSESRNLSDLLKAFYDAVETHRVLLIERAVLHRDLSVNNILINPKYRPLGKGDHYFKPQNPLRSIDDVLKPEPDSDATDSACCTVMNDRARCLIIDFDNSSPAHKDLLPAILKKNRPAADSTQDLTPEHVEQALRERTGTPIFISRSVASGRTLYRHSAIVKFSPMPALSGAAKEKYVAAYGIPTYEKWCDRDQKTHGGHVLPANAEVPKFSHKPCHDVESIFWTLLYSLVKALPANSSPEVSFADGVEMVGDLVLRHTIKGSSAGNLGNEVKRTTFLGLDPEIFESTLHPQLQGRGLGALLKQLAEQVAPEYAYLDPVPPIDHLHEAFRRILLDFIVDLDAHPDRNVELNQNKSRSLVEPSPINTNGKRPAGESGNDSAPSGSKRSKYSTGEYQVSGSRVISHSSAPRTAPSDTSKN